MRNTFSTLLVEAVRNNNKTFILSGDHGYALFDLLRNTYPEHFINAGVAEQNMVGVAAGLAKNGFIPIVYGLGSFIPIRVLEQIKLDICFEKLKVIFIGDGAGAVYTTLGVSHQTFEDIAVLRAIPNIQIFSPGNPHEMEWCFEKALNYEGPSYIRIGKTDLGYLNPKNEKINEKGITFLKKGKSNEPLIFATGSMVRIASTLVDEFFPDMSLISICKIKPIQETDLDFLNNFSASLITIEEHNVIGGLGGTLAELTSSFYPRKIIRLGSNDCFTKHCGSYEYVMKEHGLDLNSLQLKIKENIYKHPLFTSVTF